MAQNCYICNRQDGGVEKTKLNIFDTKTPMSGKKVYEILYEISGMVVRDECKINNNLCAKCYKALLEYDYLLARLNEMKADIRHNIIRSEDIRIAQEKIKKEATINERSGQIGDNVMKRVKLVVPASKLQPLPPGFNLKLKASHNFALSKPNPLKTGFVNPVSASGQGEKAGPQASSSSDCSSSVVGNLATGEYTITKSNSHLCNKNPDLFCYVCGEFEPGFDWKSKASHNLALSKTSPVKTVQPKVSSSKLLQTTTVTTPTTTQQQNDIKNQIATEMPILLPNDISTLLDKKDFSLNDFVVVKETKDDENNDDHPMEIDEGAMIMDAENASIISVVSHQKFLYGNSEISLVMPHAGVAMDQQDDGQDSNSESHIELQVSGDEETAKAIIAAATEQGGTFIKVGSGEMFEVKSIESKIQDSYKTGEDPLRLDDNMVEIADGQFKCLFCERSQKTVKSEPVLGKAEWMMEHLKTVHSARLYICNCGAIIRKRVDYSAHLENHADKLNNLLSPQAAEKLSKLHECEICKKKFSSRLVLSGHMNMHTGERPYTCDVCNKSFASRYTQQAHMKTHAERPRPFKCNECGKSFFTQHNLNHHEKIHSGNKDFVCTVCDKAFGTQHNLEVHGVVHSGLKPFVCTVCDKGFARRAEVRDHMRIHTGERPFECETCGARFSQRSNLHSHRRATHLNDKRHQCPHCSKRFKRRRLLEYHIKSSHTGERPLKCEVCSATFIYPEHYKKHIRIHSGEKPYVCEVCGKGFNSRDNRNVHRFVHSDRKPYECVLCGAGYMRKHLLYQHMNSTGHLSESIVVNQPRVNQIEDEESKIQSVIISEDNKDDELMNAVYETEALQVLAANDKDAQTQDNTTTQYILSTGSKAISLVQEGDAETDDGTFLTIQNFENSETIEGTVLENITAEQLEQTHILSDGNNTVRLIQIQLADGGCGWVAVSQ